LFANTFNFSTTSAASSTNTQQINRVQIYPGNVTVNVGQNVVFSAIAFDSEDNPISGVGFTWQSQKTESGAPVLSMQNSTFSPQTEGTYNITASAQGYQAQVTVTVLPGVNPQTFGGQTEQGITVSSRDAKKKNNGTNNLNPETEDGGWNDSNAWSSDEPGNSVGNPPGQAATDGAGSGNFQMSAPVLSLAGRGIDLALGLSYNSRLWNKAGNEVTFDIDRGWPAPGWSLGFGKMICMGVTSGAMMVDADGTRHSYSGTLTPLGNGAFFFTGHTSDGTFIDYSFTLNDGAPWSGTANLPNGTQVLYGAQGDAAVYPTRITDAQGNYITITYRNNHGPKIETITDTMGRVVTFQYDSSERLISIKTPNINSNGQRTWVRLHYRQIALNTSFTPGIQGMVRNNDYWPWVLDAIYYPGTNTGYWFGDADSYSTYGMLAKVIEQRGMSWSASAEEQGTITQGQMTKQALYNYPLTTTNETGRTNGLNLSDAPTYTELRENWAESDDGEAITTYDVQQNSLRWS
jgi:YD repeat-containing protein